MPAAIRLAMQGFSAFERDVMRSFFRLAPGHGYQMVDALADAGLVVADADRADAVAAVVAAGRVADTVFVGKRHAPAEAMTRLPRPLDALLVLRELDALAGRAVIEPVLLPPPHAETHELYAVEPAEVMVVDDDARARQWLGGVLAQLGLRATLLDDGRSALEQLAHRRPAFVLIAVELGSDNETALDGLVLCRRVKQDVLAAYGPSAPPPPVVLLSDSVGASERVLGQLAGCDAYLAQPVDPAMLARTLATLQPALFGLSGGRRRTRTHRE